MEITQFTYFQQAGGYDLNPVSVELTYGLERIAMYVQQVDSVYNLIWTEGILYGDVYHRREAEYSTYNFEVADTGMLFQMFDLFEKECSRLVKKELALPAYDFCLKCSHTFNILDARGAISVTERTGFIHRVRDLAGQCAATYLRQRESMEYPLMDRFS
jgi:glycyl-tRNA synthetase alpha chain